MAPVRWTPMGHLRSVQEELNRLFHEFFRSGCAVGSMMSATCASTSAVTAPGPICRTASAYRRP